MTHREIPFVRLCADCRILKDVSECIWHFSYSHFDCVGIDVFAAHFWHLRSYIS